MSTVTSVLPTEIAFLHMGVQHLAVQTEMVKDDYVLFDIYNQEDVFVDSVFLHPNENTEDALVVWSAYH